MNGNRILQEPRGEKEKNQLLSLTPSLSFRFYLSHISPNIIIILVLFHL